MLLAMRWLVVALWLLVAGCPEGDGAVGSSAEVTGGEAVGPDRTPAEVTAREAETTAPAPEALDADLFRRVAEGDRALAELIDPRKGLVLIEYFSDASGEDPRADPDGTVRIAERLCGDDLTAGLERLSRDLALRAEQSSFDPTFACEGLACTHPAEMEFDVSGTYRFDRRDDGTLRLESVTRIEGAAVLEEFLERAREWTEQQRARLAGGDCAA